MASYPITITVFETLADLRLQTGTNNNPVKVLGLNNLTDGNGGDYVWNSASLLTDDGFTAIQVTGNTTGRWLRMINSNTLKGSVTFNSAIGQTAYNVAFNQTLPAVPAMVIVQNYSLNGTALNYVSNITTTGFTFNYAVAPVVAANNITVYWLVIKQ